MVFIGFNQEKWHFFNNFCHCQGLYFRDVLVPLKEFKRSYFIFLQKCYICGRVGYNSWTDSTHPCNTCNTIRSKKLGSQVFFKQSENWDEMVQMKWPPKSGALSHDVDPCLSESFNDLLWHVMIYHDKRHDLSCNVTKYHNISWNVTMLNWKTWYLIWWFFMTFLNFFCNH